MNTERLLTHYEQIVDAPDAIARLRRFILDLAVRGKLVPQDPKDEPASELLKRIANEKSQLDRKKRTKREPRNFNDDAEPIYLPKGWALPPLADLVAVLNGRAYKQSELLSSGTPVLRVGNLFTSDRWYYSTLQLEEDKYCDKGDLIFAWSASFGPFIWTGDKVIYHYHIWKLPLYSETNLDKLYLYNFLLQKTRDLKEAGHGISMIHMTKEKMERILVPLPPLAEQRRIVAKIDELMVLCDRLEAARESREGVRDRLAAASLARLNAPDSETFQADARFALDALPVLTTRPNQVKALRQTILNLAVRGKLVPQNANDEPASDLHRRLSKSLSHRLKDGGRGTRTQVAAGLIEHPPYELPLGWSWTRMGELGDTNIGLTYSPGEVNAQGVPVLRSNNIQAGKIDLSGLVRVSGALKPSVMARQGDMLICARNGSRSLVGKAAIIGELPEPMAFGAFMAIFRSPLNPYLHIFVTSPVFRQVIDEVNTTTINQVTQANLRSTLVPLPPLAEQQRIVAKVDALMALCDRLEANLIATAGTRRRLLDALLAEALASAEKRELEAAE